MASYRHLARIAVIQTIFSYEAESMTGPDETLEYLLKHFHPKAESSADFAFDLLDKSIKKKKEIKKIIEKYAPEWPYKMIAPVDRAVLIVGVCEMVYGGEDVPPVVAINEAIEIAKQFGGENSGKFVNGVLSSVMEGKLKKVKKKKAN